MRLESSKKMGRFDGTEVVRSSLMGRNRRVPFVTLLKCDLYLLCFY